MCLVEVKNLPKPLVSCTISAKSILENNGTIYTDSPLVKKARENIMEFLLLNHPLDCPVCDQGGECDLQDQALFFGFTKKRFYTLKRVVTDKNLGPVVKTVMTRCIHCTRCVRFATEIAGVEDLGMFGRGFNSEIGTYVEKVFQSELSGNVIDLCPVGALTAKPYPFVARGWELKMVETIDCFDGFGLPIQLFTKNNKIVKVSPGLLNHSPTTNWISDKTRFAFDILFSPEKTINSIFFRYAKKQRKNSNWSELFINLTKIFYLHDQLTKHQLFNQNFVILFNNNLNSETLSLLNILEKKIPFIKLRTTDTIQKNNTLDYNLKTTTNLINNKLFNLCDLCFLIGINTRYEGYHLNLKIRQRYLKGNFKLFSLGSLINLTFPLHYYGLNLKNYKFITEGNHPSCGYLVGRKEGMKNIYFIYSSEVLKRKDSGFLSTVFNVLQKNLKNYTKNYAKLEILNTSINTVGVNYLNNFKKLNESDFKHFTGLYLIDIEPLEIQKLLNLKLLNYFKIYLRQFPKVIIEQNGGFMTKNFENLNNSTKVYTYINLPNKILTETENYFLNTEGHFKKSNTIVSTQTDHKDSWYLVRNFFSHLNGLKLVTYPNQNIFYQGRDKNEFINYCNYLFYTTVKFTVNLIELNKLSNYCLTFWKFKFQKKKIYKTNFQIWLDDFYLKGKGFYAQYSLTMIKCSKSLRLDSTNFTQLQT